MNRGRADWEIYDEFKFKKNTSDPLFFTKIVNALGGKVPLKSRIYSFSTYLFLRQVRKFEVEKALNFID